MCPQSAKAACLSDTDKGKKHAHRRHILLRMFSRRVSFPVCRHLMDAHTAANLVLGIGRMPIEQIEACLVKMPGLRVSSRTTF